MSIYEIITVTISAIALALSLYAAISAYYEKHLKAKIYALWFFYFDRRVNVNFIFSNMSSRPKTITKIWIKYDDKVAESTWYKARMSSTKINGKDICTFSDMVPVNIPSRSSCQAIISFTYLNNFPIPMPEKLTFIFEIDGTKVEKTFNTTKQLTVDEQIIAVEHDLWS
ncbi:MULTISPECIES: hypothetical protein [Lactobacillus]|uniref:Uncharacterized protein n=2 Tax=Lactobacillus jensenii TaxID=109790 RepID=A0A5N1IC98_LACJE|nr:hypothetical protein [Lactobacillus jensenii]KAA9322978.1 hypothetical protein F6H94_04280 [Lactobacillus jensenii]MCW8071627.1 hypothetical protein [Lactobacillus jensenii]MDK7318633.1 hypothetical protein [Lactobacillus jensenii]MDK8235862.1 hypothetical protein [Lactobacillus jensenii]MDT9586447.1 hypothetical protein [Lactobacillus jensenii]